MAPQTYHNRRRREPSRRHARLELVVSAIVLVVVVVVVLVLFLFVYHGIPLRTA